MDKLGSVLNSTKPGPHIIPPVKMHCGESELECEATITNSEIYRPENCKCHTILSRIQLLDSAVSDLLGNGF